MSPQTDNIEMKIPVTWAILGQRTVDYSQRKGIDLFDWLIGDYGERIKQVVLEYHDMITIFHPHGILYPERENTNWLGWTDDNRGQQLHSVAIYEFYIAVIRQAYAEAGYSREEIATLIALAGNTKGGELIRKLIQNCGDIATSAGLVDPHYEVGANIAVNQLDVFRRPIDGRSIVEDMNEPQSHLGYLRRPEDRDLPGILRTYIVTNRIIKALGHIQGIEYTTNKAQPIFALLAGDPEPYLQFAYENGRTAENNEFLRVLEVMSKGQKPTAEMVLDTLLAYYQINEPTAREAELMEACGLKRKDQLRPYSANDLILGDRISWHHFQGFSDTFPLNEAELLRQLAFVDQYINTNDREVEITTRQFNLAPVSAKTDIAAMDLVEPMIWNVRENLRRLQNGVTPLLGIGIGQEDTPAVDNLNQFATLRWFIAELRNPQSEISRRVWTPELLEMYGISEPQGIDISVMTPAEFRRSYGMAARMPDPTTGQIDNIQHALTSTEWTSFVQSRSPHAPNHPAQPLAASPPNSSTSSRIAYG